MTKDYKVRTLQLMKRKLMELRNDEVARSNRHLSDALSDVLQRLEMLSVNISDQIYSGEQYIIN